MVQPVAHLCEERNGHFQRHWAILRLAIRQQLAFEVWHNQINEAALCLSEPQDVAHVGMVQSHGETRLTAKPLHGRFVAEQLGCQHLYRHRIARVQLSGLIDVGHPAFAHPTQHLVASIDDLILERGRFIRSRSALPLHRGSHQRSRNLGVIAAQLLRWPSAGNVYKWTPVARAEPSVTSINGLAPRTAASH